MGLSDWFGRLFGGKGGDSTAAAESVDYNGFSITPTYRQQSGQWLTAGIISKPEGDGVREHHFIRAETHADKERAAEFAIAKGKQIIDERGDGLFEET